MKVKGVKALKREALQRAASRVVRLRKELQEVENESVVFDEPYLSEGSRRVGMRNNPIRGSLIEAGWHLRVALCVLQQKMGRGGTFQRFNA